MAANDPMVVGIGRSPYSRNSGRTTGDLATEACRNAIADAGMALSDVDGIIEFNVGDSANSLNVAYALGLPGLRLPVDLMAGGNVVTQAVAMVAGRLVIEASGGITLDSAAAIAACGVDYLSSGAITHSSSNLDVGLDIEM